MAEKKVTLSILQYYDELLKQWIGETNEQFQEDVYSSLYYNSVVEVNELPEDDGTNINYNAIYTVVDEEGNKKLYVYYPALTWNEEKQEYEKDPTKTPAWIPLGSGAEISNLQEEIEELKNSNELQIL